MPIGPVNPVDPDVDTGFPFPTFHSDAKEHPVLWDFDHYNTLMELPLPVIRTGTQNMGNGVYWLKAGTPLSKARAVANTSDAACIVAEDFYFYENKPNQAKLAKVIVQGYVDLAEAEARSGLTYTEDALSALETAGIVMVDGKLAAPGGGSSGGGVLVVHGEMDYDVNPPGIKNVDASVADIVAFVRGGGMAFFDLEPVGILPCNMAFLDDNDVSYADFSSVNLYPSGGDYPAEIIMNSVSGTSGMPDTWSAEQITQTLS